MSKENIALVRRGFDAYSDGDLEAFIQQIDPEIEWDISAHPLPDVPDRGQGRDGMLRMLSTYLEGWVDYRVELTELIDAGDQVVAIQHETARMRGTGVDLDRDLAVVWTVRGGRMTFLRIFKTREEAVAAADAGP